MLRPLVSPVLLDIVRDLKRVNAHLAAAAYPVLEGRGELLSSRLKQEYHVAGFRAARTRKNDRRKAPYRQSILVGCEVNVSW